MLLTKIKRFLKIVFNPVWLVIDKSTGCIAFASYNKQEAKVFLSMNMSDFLGKLRLTRAKFLCDCDYFWC